MALFSATPAQAAPAADAKSRRLAAEAAASGLPALLVAARRVADTVAHGVHGRRRSGSGETFWQFRRYMAGDSGDRIDWRQTAKTDHVFVRESEWEAAQTVWLWRDRSPSMVWSSAPRLPRKVDRAELLVVALASLLARGGERIGLLGSTPRALVGRYAVNRLADLLFAREDPGLGVPPAARVGRHANVMLAGDFLGPLEETDAAIRAIAASGARGHLVHIVDPAEEGLPYSGRTRFEGLEDEGALMVSRVENVRAEYRAVFAAHVAGLRDIARAYGWGYVEHRTDRAPELALMTLWLALTQPGGP
ncbi:MAG: DUF58 domain-containing protein [Alphaproteobacteria bacterium]|nr:DUF58 domain-containing protein [Alphaproteobacteria bacterium]